MKKTILITVLAIFAIAYTARGRPDQIIYFRVYQQTNNSYLLGWVLPPGNITNIDVRHSLNPITVLNWANAASVPSIMDPGIQGITNYAVLPGLTNGPNNYFAIKVQDDSGSGISSWSTPKSLVSPVLPSGGSGVYSLTLAWNPSPTSSVNNYNMYYGTQSGVYTNTLSTLGNVTTCVVSNLDYAVTYYFACTATDNTGTESDFSNEISYQYLKTPP